MADKRLLLIGATGYFGSELFGFLLDSPYEITVIVRNTVKFEKIKKRFNCRKKVEILEIDVSKEFNLERFDYIINASGIVNSVDKNKYDINISSVKNILHAIGNNNGNQNSKTLLIHISSIITNCRNRGPYAQSKYLAEKLILKSGEKIKFTIIKPPYIYGIDKKN